MSENKIPKKDIENIPLREECFREMMVVVLKSNCEIVQILPVDEQPEFLKKLYMILASYLTEEGQKELIEVFNSLIDEE